jgi:hypothetical protein
VDGVSPSLTRVRIVSSPGESGFYGLDEEIGLEVQFGEEVHVTGAEDLSLMLSIGEHLRAATLVGGSGTDTLTFRYAVQSDDHDDDGVSIGPNALQGGTIEDAAGNAVVRSFGGLAADSGHKVDGVSPSRRHQHRPQRSAGRPHRGRHWQRGGAHVQGLAGRRRPQGGWRQPGRDSGHCRLDSGRWRR